MYEIYAVLPVAKNLPLEILCITAQDDTILAGTKNGFLVVYKPNRDSAPGRRDLSYSVTMCKNFSKKPVTQLQVKQQILLSLSDGILTAHDIHQVNYPVMATLIKSKGATMFATTDQIDKDTLYICVVMRRKIQLYQWIKREFVEIQSDWSFPDTVRTVAWCGKKLAVAVRDEYFLVDACSETDSNSSPTTATLNVPKQLFTTGNRSIEPLILPIPDLEVAAFCRDEALLFVNFEGQIMSRELPDIPWSEVPAALAYDSPFMVAILSRNVEIRSTRPNLCVQTVELEKPKFVAFSSSFQVFVAGPHDIWCLSAVPRLKQSVHELTKDKQYELAIRLTEKAPPSVELEREKKLMEIKKSYAFHLYLQRRFKEAFELYSETGEEVLFVIGLFPDLLTEDVNLKLKPQYPERLLSGLNPEEHKQGLQALQSYLSAIRTKIAYGLDSQPKLREKLLKEKTEGVGIEPEERRRIWDEKEIETNRNLLQIVDTTLLKCYLETNEMMVASLLRLRDNSCNVAETEKVLRQRDKYHELFLLYERKQMHTEALELLKSQARLKNSPLRGLEKTVTYLQNLGKDHMDLIFQYADWVFRENAEEGLRIFTEDCEEVRELDRERVLEFLFRQNQSQIIPYLEHIIQQWAEETPRFHDTLAEQYLSKIKVLMTKYLSSLPEGHEIAAAGKEPEELGVLRSKLLTFLEFSLRYSAEMLLVQIPHDAFYEERALVLGRLRQHKQALAIYTNILHDYKAAEQYCRNHYSAHKPEDSQVFLLLLEMYAQPPDSSILGVMHSRRPRPRPNIHQALRVLKDYAGCINTVRGAELLSGDIRLDELWVAVEAVLQETATKRRREELNRGLFYANHVRAQGNKMRAESAKLTIDYNSVCSSCSKRISGSAFVRYPDGKLVHYFCYKQGTSGGKPSTDNRKLFIPPQ